MRSQSLPRLVRYLAFAGVLAMLSAPSVNAQSSAPAPDARTVQVVKTALERAARVWGTAGVVDGGAATGTGAALTGQAAVVGAGLAHAAGVLIATGVAADLYMSRSGSIARFGNPYGLPAEDIAFPLQRRIRARRAQRAMPAPYPVPEPAPDAQQPDEPRAGRVYATYTRYNQRTGLYYSGRTSAVIDLDQSWRAQAKAAVEARHGHHNDDEQVDPSGAGFEQALLDEYAVGLAVDYTQRYRDAAYLAIRGREQQLIDFHGARRARAHKIETFRGGARSDTARGEALTENVIRAVAKENVFGEIFHAAANLAFGQLAPYTGHMRYHE